MFIITKVEGFIRKSMGIKWVGNEEQKLKVVTRLKSHTTAIPNIIMGSDCWVWGSAAQGGGSRGGKYGVISIQKKMLYAHRVSFALFNGAIGAGLEVDHRCENTRCVQPLHLQAVSGELNNLLNHLRKATKKAVFESKAA